MTPPVGKPFRQDQRRPSHERHHNPAAGHADRHQRHGPEQISTGDIVRLVHQGKTLTGRAVIKRHGTRVALHGTKPQASTKVAEYTLLSPSPR